jgi:GSH-dependent disulfide-bond oxidoreductase
MTYLAEMAGRLLPTEAKARSRALQWLMFQIGGVGPMQGQANVFYRYFPEQRLTGQNEVKRLYRVLDFQLARHEWLAGDFSIADIANWSWCRIHNRAGASVDNLPNLRRWMAALERRPGSSTKGVAVPSLKNPRNRRTLIGNKRIGGRNADPIEKPPELKKGLRNGQGNSLDDPRPRHRSRDQFLR